MRGASLPRVCESNLQYGASLPKGRTILHGGDVDENADFQTNKVGMQGRYFLW